MQHKRQYLKRLQKHRSEACCHHHAQRYILPEITAKLLPDVKIALFRHIFKDRLEIHSTLVPDIFLIRGKGCTDPSQTVNGFLRFQSDRIVTYAVTDITHQTLRIVGSNLNAILRQHVHNFVGIGANRPVYRNMLPRR